MIEVIYLNLFVAYQDNKKLSFKSTYKHKSYKIQYLAAGTFFLMDGNFFHILSLNWIKFSFSQVRTLGSGSWTWISRSSWGAGQPGCWAVHLPIINLEFSIEY